MNRLIVVGNGFDLAHKLETKLENFVDYLSKEFPNYFNQISKYIPKEKLWSSFEEALGLLDTEQLKEDNIFYLKDYGYDNWSDSMHHDYQYMIKKNYLLPTIYLNIYTNGSKQ